MEEIRRQWDVLGLQIEDVKVSALYEWLWQFPQFRS